MASPENPPHGILHLPNSSSHLSETRRVSIAVGETASSKDNPAFENDDVPTNGHSPKRSTDSHRNHKNPLGLRNGFPEESVYDKQTKEQRSLWDWLGLWPNGEQFARLAAFILIGLLIWGIIFVLIGEDASPFGGQLFQIASLCIVAKLGGWLASRVRLPALLGMLVVGIIAKNVGLIDVHGEYEHVVADIRRVALVIILIRAGLDLDPNATRKLFGTILKLGLAPWLIECCMIAVMTHFLLGLPWGWAFMLGSIEAAVSPAVVVPGLLRLRLKGFGVAKGIPTLILAVTGIDDAFSVAAFGVISSMMLTAGSLVYTVALGPASVLLGVAFGVVWGNLTRFVPKQHDPYSAHLRVLLLFFGGLMAVLGSDEIGYGGAGPLGVILAAFVSGCIWTDQGWEVEENPVAISFEVFWLIFEPILFGLTGTQIDFSQIDTKILWKAIICITVAAAVRIIGTIFISIGSRLNLKEKIFVSFSWMAKATVQAALGPVAIDLVRANGTEDEKEYARAVLMVCVLSILLTAPIGAVTIALTGPRLLKRTAAAMPEGWRRHTRPSLRDISINEEEELDDEEPEPEAPAPSGRRSTRSSIKSVLNR
ncbi:sodium/hydrogen exchanger 9B2-like [Neocloeon triangulifer]|uniref:sodium/hydrogen exchanger 9B2-like n=1 Tax=Neocloeon triangulifer TaxID=2078957 RepID=UPI00286F3CE6|nr:sodium/hydrogen exchanger 9B2-like [Neocloeon triangulifer]